MIGETAQARLQMRADPGRVRHQTALLDDGEILQRDSRRHRMAAGGKAVSEIAEPFRLVGDALIEGVADEDGG